MHGTRKGTIVAKFEKMHQSRQVTEKNVILWFAGANSVHYRDCKTQHQVVIKQPAKETCAAAPPCLVLHHIWNGAAAQEDVTLTSP